MWTTLTYFGEILRASKDNTEGRAFLCSPVETERQPSDRPPFGETRMKIQSNAHSNVWMTCVRQVGPYLVRA